MTHMKIRKKAALAACSDPLSLEQLRDIYKLKEKLSEEGVDAEIPGGFFDMEPASPIRKAELLTECFRDPDMDYIFDVSGGDLANLVLPHLDYGVIRSSRALFFGYSDLSTVINAIIAKTGRSAVNYQVRNILYAHAEEQIRYFRTAVLTDRIIPEDLSPEFLRGSHMEGKILGGNIRCFLKLAGTDYWPDMRDGILLLESLGGGVYQMMTALEQYRQMGVFAQINGVILGTFTKMERERQTPMIEEIVLKMVPENVPVAKTRYIGHYTDARAVVLGSKCKISRSYVPGRWR